MVPSYYVRVCLTATLATPGGPWENPTARPCARLPSVGWKSQCALQSESSNPTEFCLVGREARTRTSFSARIFDLPGNQGGRIDPGPVNWSASEHGLHLSSTAVRPSQKQCLHGPRLFRSGSVVCLTSKSTEQVVGHQIRRHGPISPHLAAPLESWTNWVIMLLSFYTLVFSCFLSNPYKPRLNKKLRLSWLNSPELFCIGYRLFVFHFTNLAIHVINSKNLCRLKENGFSLCWLSHARSNS